MSDYELPTDTKLRDMLQAKYGKPNHDVPEDGGEYAKGFVKGYNLGYDDGSRHAWQEVVGSSPIILTILLRIYYG